MPLTIAPTWLFIGIAFIIRRVKAANVTLPWGSIQPTALQNTSVQISFDPLALLAVLHNPRASGSAARLYNPFYVDGKLMYKWPNTMMIGGTLPPFKLLIDHLVSPRRSLHPAIEMFKADRMQLEVRTNLPTTSNIFPISNSNLWFLDLLDHKTESARPDNDIMIIALDSIHGQRKKVMQPDGFATKYETASGLEFALALINLGTTVLLLGGLVCSVLYGDMWSTALFALYLSHNLFSISVSSRRMLSTTGGRKNTTASAGDEEIYYMIHQRPAGGKVIIKARQDTLYSWHIASYTFNRSVINNALHWSWMVSGALSATASVICMVNMAGMFQLAYLAVLVISSGLEIVATQVVRSIQRRCIHFGEHKSIANNAFWSEAIIRAAIEVGDLSLADVPWIEYGQLPPRQVFYNLAAILPKVRDREIGYQTEAEIRSALEQDAPAGRLTERLTGEIMRALEQKAILDNRTK